MNTTRVLVTVVGRPDDEFQRLIYSKIRENLKAMSPQPAQTPTASAG